MATAKKANTQNNTIAYILGFIVGAGVVYFGSPYLKPYDISDAEASKVNGLYVFLESSPKDKDSFRVIDTFEDENLLDVASSVGIGKEKLGKVLENILVKGSEKANFATQIDKITDAVRDKYPDAQAVIFSKRLRKCEVITFSK